MGSNPCRKIQLLGIVHPVMGKKKIQVLEVHRRMKLIRDLSGGGKANLALFSIFVKIWVENPAYVLCKERRVVIKLVFV